MPRRRDVSRIDRRERDENGVPQVFALQSAIGNRASASLMREAATSSSSAAPAAAKGHKRASVTIEGEKQGKFKGSSNVKGREDAIEISKYRLAAKSPRDTASGQASGKRQYQAISFKKAIDAASPQFMQAMTTNEKLKSVTFQFYATSADTGKEGVYQTVTLTNASVSSWVQDFEGEEGSGEDMETVELVFEDITLESNIGKTSARDSWAGPASEPRHRRHRRLSGIGEATARLLAREHGARLVLVARREERLRELAAALGPDASYVVADLTDDDAPARVREAVEERHGRLDLLVNNAGAAWRATFAEGGWENVRRHMEVNFDAVVRLTEALLPLLRESAPSAIVNVSSTAGRVGRPGSGAYSASKFALAGSCDALAGEEAPGGVHVGLVLPGFISTEGFPQSELTGDRSRAGSSTPNVARRRSSTPGSGARRSATCRAPTPSPRPRACSRHGSFASPPPASRAAVS